MDVFLMYGLAIVAFALLVYLLIKKMDVKISLFLLGVILMYAALLMGKPLAFKNFSSTGLAFLDPLEIIIAQFKSTLSSAGFIILILGGYSAYMSHIEANKVTVSILLKPVKKIKSVYVLVPLVFLIGNFLSLVIPSASNLAIILLATLLPVLLESGMSVLTAAAVIATTATVMPTPLGGDNVAIAAELANTAQYAGLTVSDYVFKYHALVSVPTLLVMAVVHFFWQKIMDKKSGGIAADETIVQKETSEAKHGPLFTAVYGLLPLLPIIFLIVIFVLDIAFSIKIKLTVEIATLCSFIIAVVCEIIRNKSAKKALEGFQRNGRRYSRCRSACRCKRFRRRFKIDRHYDAFAEFNDGNRRLGDGFCFAFDIAFPDRAHRFAERKRYGFVLCNGAAYGAARRRCGYQRVGAQHSARTRRQFAACCFTRVRSRYHRCRKRKENAV